MGLPTLSFTLVEREESK